MCFLPLALTILILVVHLGFLELPLKNTWSVWKVFGRVWEGLGGGIGMCLGSCLEVSVLGVVWEALGGHQIISKQLRTNTTKLELVNTHAQISVVLSQL